MAEKAINCTVRPLQPKHI